MKNEKTTNRSSEVHPRPWKWTFGGGGMGGVVTIEDADGREVVSFASDSGDIAPFYRGLASLFVRAVNQELPDSELVGKAMRFKADERNAIANTRTLK